MSADWGPTGVDWRDQSKDELMAVDWLNASNSQNFYVSNVYDRVLELTQTDLDPLRGWSLVKTLVDLARTDKELWHVGAGPLATMVREHADLVGSELEALVRANPKYRQSFRDQTSVALHDFLSSRGLDIGT